jgi:hypothetical protein
MPKKILVSLADALLLIALSQAPFWAAQWSVSIQRPLFNLDMVLAMIVGTWRRWLGVAGVVIAWGIEILRDASHSYHFADAAEFAATARFADLVGLRYVLSWQVVLGILGMIACGWAITRQLAGDGVRRRRLAAAMFALACAFGATDALNGSNSVLGHGADRYALSVNVAGSAGWNTLRDEIGARAAAALPMRRFEQPLSYRRVLTWKRQNPRGSVLLVLVESMGLPRAAGVRDWLYSRLDTPAVARRWNVERGSEGFFGPTTFGELRVLCGLRGYYARLKPADEEQCLPRRFADAGQPSFGLHGFSLHMFDRDHWWPELGLQPQGFGGDESLPGNTHCNDAFNGVCDGVVLRHAVRLADEPGRLVYVVTLDTHLPLPWRIVPVPAELRARCVSEHVSPVACRMVDQLGHVLDQLAEDLAGMQHPPLVVVAGDHMPPFVQRDDRDAFDAGSVAWLALQPRSAP